MADIHHQIGVKADITDVYQAISSLDGLCHWWTKTTGDTNTGGKLHFHFNEHTVEMTIKELIPDKKVIWQCTDKEGEWKDTLVTFELNATEQQIFINFSHSNWLEQSDLCSHCSTKWAVFMLSLKDYLEKGKGKPFPEDTPINHLNF
jgi:uncharacterized protein YndB with AHSA1/START domain